MVNWAGPVLPLLTGKMPVSVMAPVVEMLLEQEENTEKVPKRKGMSEVTVMPAPCAWAGEVASAMTPAAARVSTVPPPMGAVQGRARAGRGLGIKANVTG